MTLAHKFEQVGVKKGRVEGRIEGIELGVEKGRMEGRMEGRVEMEDTARNMLFDGVAVDSVAKWTSLSIDDVLAIQESIDAESKITEH